MAEWYGVAAEKTEEMARIGVRKYDQLTISRTIERALTDLGAHVYGALRLGQTDFAQDPKVALAVAKLRDLEEQLARKEREIAEIRASYRPQAAEPGGTSAKSAAKAAPPAAGPPEPEAYLLAPGAAAPAADGDRSGDRAADAGMADEVDPGARRTPPVLDAWEDELSLWDEAGSDESEGEEQT